MPKENLALLLRPKTIDDIIGQQHLVGPDGPIRKMVDAQSPYSMILYGPPGIGKTSTASAIAGSLGLEFVIINAAVDSKKELQNAVKTAETSDQQQIVLLLDEIHRLDKTKQDFLLKYMEDGTFIVVGATTENPHITIRPAILSRAIVFQLKPLTPNDLKIAVDRGMDYLKNNENYNITIDDDAKTLLTESTNGDVRSVLQSLEIAVKSNITGNITVADIEHITQHKQLIGDKDGDAHYNVISALQKSIRGSDTDAALHYAARIIETGDLQILVRRLTVIAYEDIGLAAPEAVQQAITAINTAMAIGFPEARIALANAIILLSTAPKSNSAYNAINSAIETIQSGKYGDIPADLKDTHYKGATKLGNGLQYQYPHDFPYDWIPQQYLPDDLWQHHPHYFVSKHSSKSEDEIEKTYLRLLDSQKEGLNQN